MKESIAAKDEFTAESTELTRVRMRIGCFFIATITLLHIPFFYIIAPDVLPLWIRIAPVTVAISIIGCILSYNRKISPSPLMMLVLVTCAGLYMLFLILTGGSKSPFFPKLLLYILGTAFLSSWDMRYSVITFVSVFAVYSTAILIFDKEINYTLFAINIMTILGSSVMGIAGIYLWERLRIEEINRRVKDYREREHLCRYLHDSLSADLNNVILLSDIPSDREIAGPEVTKRLDRIYETSRKGLEDIRDFLFSAGEKETSLTTLIEQMNDYGNKVLGDNNVDFILNREIEDGFCDLSPLYTFNIYLIYKEALINIIKHAKAGNVKVTILHNNKRLKIAIEDDGIGFDLTLLHDDRHGIRNIRARAEEMNGIVTIKSMNGQGTRINLALPL